MRFSETRQKHQHDQFVAEYSYVTDSRVCSLRKIMLPYMKCSVKDKMFSDPSVDEEETEANNQISTVLFSQCMATYTNEVV